MDSLNEHCVHADAVMPLILERLAEGQNVRGLSFRGVSMLPMLRQGKDSVELAPLPEQLKKYDLPIYRNPAGKYVIHRIVDVREEHYVCLGDNTYHFEHVKPEQMVAIVCAFTRGGRRIAVDNRAYRAYCRAWCAIIPVRRLAKRVKWRIGRMVKK